LVKQKEKYTDTKSKERRREKKYSTHMQVSLSRLYGSLLQKNGPMRCKEESKNIFENHPKQRLL